MGAVGKLPQTTPKGPSENESKELLRTSEESVGLNLSLLLIASHVDLIKNS